MLNTLDVFSQVSDSKADFLLPDNVLRRKDDLTTLSSPSTCSSPLPTPHQSANLKLKSRWRHQHSEHESGADVMSTSSSQPATPDVTSSASLSAPGLVTSSLATSTTGGDALTSLSDPPAVRREVDIDSEFEVRYRRG